MSFVTSIATIFSTVSTDVAATRVAYSLPALSPTGSLLVGQEQLAQEHDAPRIAVVPTGVEYAGAEKMGREMNLGTIYNTFPKVFFCDGCCLMPISGETQIRRAPTRSTISHQRSNSNENLLALCGARAAGALRCGSMERGGSSRPMRCAAAVSSFCRSVSKRQSLTTRRTSSSCLTQPRRRAASRCPQPSRKYFQTALAASPGSFLPPRHEVTT